MGQRVLVVDDASEVVRLVTDLLVGAGFEVLPAINARQARQQLAREPDLAVLDIGLKGRDGFWLLEQIRRQRAMPVIMLTGRTGQEDVLRALELGADDYMTKPFSSRELLARIRARLRRAGAGEPEEPHHLATAQAG